MRPTVATALILAIGLIAAACGGDEATKAPAEPTAPPEATEAAVASEAAEVTEAPTGESTAAPTAEAATEAALAKKAVHSSADDPAATYALAGGRYRILWDASDCERGDLAVVQTDGDFTYEKSFKSSYATAVINELPEGAYTVEQRDPGCTEWSVRIDWMN